MLLTAIVAVLKYGLSRRQKQLRTFPGVGHGSMFAPPGTPAATCVEAIALDFLANPNQTPNSRCLAQVQPLFVVE